MPAHSAIAASSVKSSRPACAAFSMRGEDRPERKALRRLRRVQAGARDGFVDACRRRRRASACRRPACAGRAPCARIDRRDRPVDQVGVDEGPHGVVDQHDVRRARRAARAAPAASIPAASRRHAPMPTRSRWRRSRRRNSASSSGWMATTIVSISGMRQERVERVRNDRLARRSCGIALARPPTPARSPRPAATMMTATFGDVAGGFSSACRRRIVAPPCRKPADSRKRHIFAALVALRRHYETV